jgi:hypothetical protein
MLQVINEMLHNILANQVIPSMREVEHKQSSTSALIPEDEIIGSSFQNDELSLVNLTDDVEIDDPVKLRESKDKRLASSAAQREYAQAMKVIGSSSSVRRSAVVTAGPTKRSRTHQPALVLEDELVEEWIENDLPSPTRKPNKKSNYSLPVHKPSYQSDKEKTPSSSRPNKYKINQIEHCKIK